MWLLQEARSEIPMMFCRHHVLHDAVLLSPWFLASQVWSIVVVPMDWSSWGIQKMVPSNGWRITPRSAEWYHDSLCFGLVWHPILATFNFRPAIHARNMVNGFKSSMPSTGGVLRRVAKWHLFVFRNAVSLGWKMIQTQSWFWFFWQSLTGMAAVFPCISSFGVCRRSTKCQEHWKSFKNSTASSRDTQGTWRWLRKLSLNAEEAAAMSVTLRFGPFWSLEETYCIMLCIIISFVQWYAEE